MRISCFETLLTLSGGLLILLSLLPDLFHLGSAGIGYDQLAGIVIGCILILISLRRLLLPNQRKWDWLLFGVYLAGILFMGLHPGDFQAAHSTRLFHLGNVGFFDLLVNITGFIPLGFLAMAAMAYRQGHKESLRHIVVAISLGMMISILLESLQYYWIPGRYSSAYDLIANTAGTAIGVMGYLLANHHAFRCLTAK